MKKLVILAFMFCFMLTGCSHEDINHATAEITTKSGYAAIYMSCNDHGQLNRFSGKRQAILNAAQIDDEAVTVHFYCESCGHDETVTLERPNAKLFECDCLDKFSSQGNNDNYKEYFAIVIGDSKVLEEATKEISEEGSD